MTAKTLTRLLAVTGILAIGLQYYVFLKNYGLSWTLTLGHFFSYFTVLTNTLTVVACLSISRNPNSRWSGPGRLTGLAGSMLVVALVYHLLLARLWNPQGWGWVADQLLHTVQPAGALLLWFLITRKKPHRPAEVLRWMFYPLLYLVYSLVRGHFMGWYPYPFLDVNEHGPGGVLLNSFFIALGFFLVYLILYLFSHKHARRA